METMQLFNSNDKNSSKYIHQMFYSILDIEERFSPSVSVLVSFNLLRLAVQFVTQMIRPISKQELYEWDASRYAVYRTQWDNECADLEALSRDKTIIIREFEKWSLKWLFQVLNLNFSLKI